MIFCCSLALNTCWLFFSLSISCVCIIIFLLIQLLIFLCAYYRWPAPISLTFRQHSVNIYLRAVGRKVLWSSACVCLSVCVSVCLCALFLSARYLKNGFMDHHQIWWVGAGGEPIEQVQFWCWSDSGCVSRITFPFPLTFMLATASAQVCVPLGHSSLYLCIEF